MGDAGGRFGQSGQRPERTGGVDTVVAVRGVSGLASVTVVRRRPFFVIFPPTCAVGGGHVFLSRSVSDVADVTSRGFSRPVSDVPDVTSRGGAL